jgi:hypothetical protein
LRVADQARRKVGDDRLDLIVGIGFGAAWVTARRRRRVFVIGRGVEIEVDLLRGRMGPRLRFGFDGAGGVEQRRLKAAGLFHAELGLGGGGSTGQQRREGYD